LAEISKINAVAIANVAKVDAVTKANIADINGLTVPSAGIDAFTFAIDTSLGDGTATFHLPLSGTVNFTVYWGDGNSDTITSDTATEMDHTYSTGGTYDVILDGTIGTWNTGTTTDRNKITDIKKWSTNFTSGTLGNHTELVSDTATDYPAVTNLTNFYANCPKFNGDISNWPTTWVAINICFNGCSVFNQDIGSWDVSACPNFTTTFRNCAAFNQDISGWDTSSAVNMTTMFRDCTSFNQDLSGWDVSGVSRMENMFRGCTAFSADLSGWTTTALTRMTGIFLNCSSFNSNLGSWDVTGLTQASSAITNSGISTSNYDALLIGWAAQAPNLQSNVTLSTGPQYTSAAASARNVLTSTYNWTISDGGQAP